MQHKINTTTENVTANFIIFADSMQNFVLFLSRGLQTITTFWCQYIKCANKGAGKQQKNKNKKQKQNVHPSTRKQTPSPKCQTSPLKRGDLSAVVVFGFVA